jgi:hypothetical protein
MTTTSPQPPPCSCIPYLDGHHGIVLHADQVDDLVDLLTTIEHWLLQANSDVHHHLHHYLTTGHRPTPARHLLTDQVDNLIHRLTTTTQDWLHHPEGSRQKFPSPPGQDPTDQLLDRLLTTTCHLTRAGHDPRLAATPC